VGEVAVAVIASQGSTASAAKTALTLGVVALEILC
jgi:hypothetical protein